MRSGLILSVNSLDKTLNHWSIKLNSALVIPLFWYRDSKKQYLPLYTERSMSLTGFSLAFMEFSYLMSESFANYILKYLRSSWLICYLVKEE